MIYNLGVCFLAASLSGCAVVSVTDAMVTATATTVKVATKVIGTAVDVGASGVKAVTTSKESD